ncbi:hypothetical protein BKA56DRAFT_711885 [Ilyonectria sp. MPI-CAGE-AT-0026]|nr:hypothetical protein BKA56DRAFT_711885 [Ilyonectria sp. MPI-CAGE-AT-0026]
MLGPVFSVNTATMEALVAIGLSGNVVQFVQFAGQLISETNSIRQNGSPSSLPDLRNLTDSLTKQADAIHKSLPSKASTAMLAPEDHYLVTVAADCQNAGRQFLSYLDTFISQSTSSNRLKSVGASIKFQFSQQKIEDFASHLDKLRGSSTLASILAFRASSNTSVEEIQAHLKTLH